MFRQKKLSCFGKSMFALVMLAIIIILAPVALAVSLFLVYYYSKNPDESKKKYAIIASIISGLLSLFLVYSVLNDDKTSDAPVEINQLESSEIQTVESVVKEDEIKTEEFKYADNEVVNRFIASYNSFSSSPLVNVHQGNIGTKYFGESFGYWVEMLDAADTDKIVVKLDQTNDTAPEGVAGMKSIFHDVVKAIKPELADNEINTYFEELVNEDSMIEDEFHSLGVKFFPDKELSNGFSRGHIEIREK